MRPTLLAGKTTARTGLTPPLFESDRGRDEFVARYFFHHLLRADDVAWLGRFRDLHLTDDEARALIVAREAGAIDNATCRALTRVDTNAASVTLRRLRDADVLAQRGRGSTTYYVPGPRMLEADSAVDSGVPLSGESGSLYGELDALSGESRPLSREPDALSREPSALSRESPMVAAAEEEARRALLEPLPGDLAARLGALGRRHPPDEVRAVVLELLRQRA